ncbi:EamA family transporter [Sphingomonas morindae]|uniref:EamA family transporter n=1 Tax=Sphingomonas morindae TaxID=1541170 RepID=A0ABY4XAL5_9SPHN|nr:EamA family transporter [Sphingomonas morindae]USI73987.1 EamA family transporter [Sphingomonas morindae]
MIRRGGAGAAIAALLAAMLCFQLGASTAKQLFGQIGADGTTALRNLLGGLMLALVLRPWRRLPPRAAWPALLVYGVALGTMNLLFYRALRTVPLGVAVAIEFVGPLGVAAASIRRPAEALWIALALAGLACLLPWHEAAHGVDRAGALYALGAGGLWAIYILAGQRAGGALGAHAVAWGTLVAALVCAPIGIASAGRTLLDPAVLGLGLLVALLSSALPYSLEMIALTALPARAYGTLTSLDPALAALAGLALLGERLAGVQWLGILAIVAASIGTTRALRPTPPIAGGA